LIFFPFRMPLLMNFKALRPMALSGTGRKHRLMWLLHQEIVTRFRVSHSPERPARNNRVRVSSGRWQEQCRRRNSTGTRARCVHGVPMIHNVVVTAPEVLYCNGKSTLRLIKGTSPICRRGLVTGRSASVQSAAIWPVLDPACTGGTAQYRDTADERETGSGNYPFQHKIRRYYTQWK
jgi:hypothetical protein